MAATTTIKVTTELRDRINRDALGRGVSAARFLEEMLDDYERAQRLLAVGLAMRENPPGEDYWDEFAEIDAVGGGVADG